jgi:hypothetical protein
MPWDVLTQHPVVVYVLIAAYLIWKLPEFGRRVLAFLRDLDEYRRTRRDGR